MRIACIHVPQFALQCATRLDPSLRGAPVAVVGHGTGVGPLQSPIVIACSRAAWALGVRLGITAAAARARAAGLVVVPLEAALEREVARGLADAVLGVAAAVELGTRTGASLAMYAELPAKLRGAAFGERVVELVGELGLTARVGIADDRFTAHVAAAYGSEDDHAVACVPRGGSAAFLAPRPLSLLPIAPEVRHMLEALGVTTLGAFAALPAPSAARPLEADYQALARGEGGAALRPYTPDGPIREDVVVGAGNVLDTAGALAGPGAIALVARRLARRLVGRGRLAAQLEIRVDGEEVPLALARATAEPEQLARALAPVLDAAPRAAWRLRVDVSGEVAVGGEPVIAEPVAAPPTIDPIAVVLSATSADGLGNWTLSPPTARELRRDVYRRTRRGKQRRARPTAPTQPRLFDAVPKP